LQEYCPTFWAEVHWEQDKENRAATRDRRRVRELASSLIRNQVPRKGLGVRVPCPPLLFLLKLSAETGNIGLIDGSF
jgi:hypothetical protein